MKLTQLAIDNYKRITVAVIDIDPMAAGVVALMGENEQGKSSALDALEALIAGRKAPKVAKPVHTGADKAVIVATFAEDGGGELTVRRVYKPDGSTTIVVTQDGMKVARADDILRRLYSHVALDPLAFANLPSKEQTDTLLALVGFDPRPLDDQRANVFATRTEVGQDVRRIEGELASYPPAVEPIPEPISIAETMAELDAAMASQGAATDAGSAANDALQHHGDAVGDLEQAREELAKAQARVVQAEGAVENWATTVDSRDEEAVKAAAAVIDPEPIRERLNSAEAHNALVATQKRRRDVETILSQRKARADELTKMIADIDAQKVAGFAAAPMPVPGLTIEDGVVHLDGTPFSQTSAGGKLRTSVAIAMALNPDLRAIVVRDGSLLDGKNRAVIDELAKANDFTVLMEVVDETSATGVVFEDGRIREPRA